MHPPHNLTLCSVSPRQRLWPACGLIRNRCLPKQDPGTDEHGSTCLLIFHAGPPYEDIAFKILNKEWEYSHKKGFKCSFERGILHLYFNFKRQRYRR
jgi:hypothetical protein